LCYNLSHLFKNLRPNRAQTATNRDQPLEIKMPQKKAATFSVPTAEPHIPPIETERLVFPDHIAFSRILPHA
jgi:hypothetical protein